MRNSESWKVTLAGECMISRPMAMHDDPSFLAAIERLRGGDVTYAHLEMNFGAFDELDWPSRGDWTASYMIADGGLAADLKWAGIDIMSLAHNHSFDFGAAGILQTIRHCQAAGLVCAGTGLDLEDAREPAYLETRRGRVALISASTGNKGFEWAGLPKAGLKGRPGVNPLRVKMQYQVDAAAATQLRRIAEILQIGKVTDGGTGEGGRITLNFPADQSTRNAAVFDEGAGFGITSECNAHDLAGNLRSVDEAAKMADLVMVAHHFNLAEGRRGDEPPSFARTFARACIDAGADVYIGHGWHKTLGIEIYRGKPIFYGVGNFIAQSEFIRRVPFDSYEAWDHDIDRLPMLNPGVYPLHPGLDIQEWWSSAIIDLGFENGQIREIRLYPVELGRTADPSCRLKRQTGSGPHAFTEGRPFLADAEDGRFILERFQRLSEPLGTEVVIEGNVGVVRL